MINFLRFIALFLTLLPASALSEPPILVGVLLPLTGEVTDYGAKLRKGIEQLIFLVICVCMT
jgi:hypothetical protein